MTGWTSEELTGIGTAEELEIAFLRGDGPLSGPRTIWVVPYRDGLHVRSVNGPPRPGTAAPRFATKAASAPAASTRTSPSPTPTPT